MSLFVHFAKLLLGQLLFLSLLRDAVVGPSRLESGQLSGAGLGTVWQPHGIHVSAIIKIVIVYESLGLSVTIVMLKEPPIPPSSPTLFPLLFDTNCRSVTISFIESPF
jgi:hypothetical protein